MMNNDNIDLSYAAQNVAETLGIGRSTLNKYSRSLEEHGYTFAKDDRGNRVYTEHDIVALRHFTSLLTKNIMYDKEIRTTADKYGRFIEGSSYVASADMNSDKNAAVTGKLVNSDTIFEEVVALRSDVDNLIEINLLLVQQLQEELETRLQIAASSELTAEKRVNEILDAERHNERMRDEIERRDAQVITFMRDTLATKQEIAAVAEEKHKKSVRSRILVGYDQK
jgi:biotin operon repressor